MFGKWIDIIQRVREESTQEMQPLPSQNQEKQKETTSILATGDSTAEQTKQSEPQWETQEKSKNESETPPTEEDFNIPTTKEAYESMIEKFKEAELSTAEADEAIKTPDDSLQQGLS